MGSLEDHSRSKPSATHEFAAAHYCSIGALHLENFYRAVTTRDPHVLGKKSAGESGPRRDFSAEKFDLFVPTLDRHP